MWDAMVVHLTIVVVVQWSMMHWGVVLWSVASISVELGSMMHRSMVLRGMVHWGVMHWSVTAISMKLGSVMNWRVMQCGVMGCLSLMDRVALHSAME